VSQIHKRKCEVYNVLDIYNVLHKVQILFIVINFLTKKNFET